MLNKKVIFLILIGFICLCNSCKSHQKSEVVNSINLDLADKRTIGYISHKYKADGCGSVIIISDLNYQPEVVIIPKDPLPKEIDKEGVKIKFNYRKLKMPNPNGCNIGGMAEISEISIK